MIRHFLYTFTDGNQTLYIVVATHNATIARNKAWESIQTKLEAPSLIGLNYVKTMDLKSDYDMMVANNEHYNLNFQEIDNLINENKEGVSIGEWVKE